MRIKFERLLSKSLTTLEVLTYYLVVHTGHAPDKDMVIADTLFRNPLPGEKAGQLQEDV